MRPTESWSESKFLGGTRKTRFRIFIPLPLLLPALGAAAATNCKSASSKASSLKQMGFVFHLLHFRPFIPPPTATNSVLAVWVFPMSAAALFRELWNVFLVERWHKTLSSEKRKGNLESCYTPRESRFSQCSLLMTSRNEKALIWYRTTGGR